ncbi:hypothetical protein XENOCAPTIV_014076 [Xenoophorus captivus]|uniref:Uncharacterized protein n=1 Tax=Xenoophorus captivus TaxID=1517983 RepID=A0ABV0RSB9_9TELE
MSKQDAMSSWINCCTSLSVCIFSDLLEDLERSPDAAAIAECFVERVSSVLPWDPARCRTINDQHVLENLMQVELLNECFHITGSKDALSQPHSEAFDIYTLYCMNYPK